jgi:hypothetical protein
MKTSEDYVNASQNLFNSMEVDIYELQKSTQFNLEQGAQRRVVKGAHDNITQSQHS